MVMFNTMSTVQWLQTIYHHGGIHAQIQIWYSTPSRVIAKQRHLPDASVCFVS
jgi:hypothetical protein